MHASLSATSGLDACHCRCCFWSLSGGAVREYEMDRLCVTEEWTETEKEDGGRLQFFISYPRSESCLEQPNDPVPRGPVCGVTDAAPRIRYTAHEDD